MQEGNIQPGQVFLPGGNVVPPEPPTPPPQPQTPYEPPQVDIPPPEPDIPQQGQPDLPEPQTELQNDPGPQEGPEPPATVEDEEDFDGNQPAPADTTAGDTISWTAAEYVQRDKSPAWYMKVSGVALLAGALTYLITREILSTVVVMIVGIALLIFAGRKPKERNYSVGHDGIIVGDRQFGYENFKSFSLFSEDAMEYISLMPTKRFMPPVALYFTPAEADKIVEVLADYLPFEERDHDFIDRLVHKVRL